MTIGNFSQSSVNWYDTPNPLLDGLPRYVDVNEIVNKMAFTPLAGLDLKSMSFVERYGLLTGEKVPLEPTTQTVRMALVWLGMLNTTLHARNPINLEARRRYWSVISRTSEGKDPLPSAPTSGISIHVIKGPTGTGKTVTARRFCQLFPQQVIEHGKNESAGWNQMSQLVWLELTVSHDGSRGGFLTNILLQMDAVLGTTYSVDLPKKYRMIDKLCSASVGRLVAHYTGIIFVDEAQLRNLVLSGHAELMQMFLLTLMNSGIPLVMIGNEKAFDWVTYSQDKSRLYINPPEIFAPVGAIDHPNDEADWDSVAKGIMDYYVLLEPITDPEGCSRALRQCSGGIARLGLTLWTATQQFKLERGEESISPADLLHAYESGVLGDLSKLAEGFYYRKPELLMLYPDVNAEYYSRQWGLNTPEESPPTVIGSNSSSPTKSAGKKSGGAKKRVTGQSLFKNEQTRNKKRGEKRDELSQSLSEDDARQREGLTKLHLNGLASLRKEKGR